jgi:hypothetical protein
MSGSLLFSGSLQPLGKFLALSGGELATNAGSGNLDVPEVQRSLGRHPTLQRLSPSDVVEGLGGPSAGRGVQGHVVVGHA